MFREKYKKENEMIEPHPVLIDDLSVRMKSAAENRAPKRCTFPFKVATVFAVAAAVTVTGMLGLIPSGNNSISAVPNQPEISVNETLSVKYQNVPFALVAYAAEGTENVDASEKENIDVPIAEKTETEIKPNAKVKIPKIRIESGPLSSDAHYMILSCELTSAFVCQGDGITSVTYTAKTGSIGNSFSDVAKNVRSSDEFKECTVKPNEPVSWYPAGAIEDLLMHPEKNQDYSLLIGDVITVTATYENGEMQTQTLHLSFDKDGNLFAERKG